MLGNSHGKIRAVRNALLAIVCACQVIAICSAAQHEQGGIEPEKLGRVNFPISCQPAVQPQFNRAVALLHSFGYQKAADAFAAIAESDPACAMASWGVAMTHYKPLWEAPTPMDLKQGLASIETAKSIGAKTERERDYIVALEIFYKDFDKLDHRTRALAYEKAMEQLRNRYPKDREAAIFYALAVLANAQPGDKTYTNQKKASVILVPIFAAHPDHPGLAHYIIHCDDYPPLAAQGLDAARRYAKIAPDSPHALHMPSHIFTRLGLWQESIESNMASAAAAREEGASGDELHARDYLIYAYLQRGQDNEAKKVLEGVPRVAPNDPAYFAGLYAIATMPARYAVERHRWTEAEALTLPLNTFPGGNYAWTETNLYFARALGAARIRDVGAARSSLQRLASLRDTLVTYKDKYWVEQADIQYEIVAAWIAQVTGKEKEALEQMRAAADHEDATDKHAVTPGAIVPARELLGEMLLDLKQPVPALEAFEATLRGAPGRFNALSGAARAAQLAGDRGKARIYYTKLLSNCDQADGDRSEIREAKAFLAQKSGAPS
ncbi:MAG: tetratricopeptide repeat protein [Terriglobales bacterium]